VAAKLMSPPMCCADETTESLDLENAIGLEQDLARERADCLLGEM